jgi:hypothetical protein
MRKSAFLSCLEADGCVTAFLRRLRTVVLIAASTFSGLSLAQQDNEGVTPQSARDQTPSAPLFLDIPQSADNATLWQAVRAVISEGHFALGVGMTYQYDGSQGTTLGVASWSSREDQYELAAFRFFSSQTRRGDVLAEPNWILEASRRWRLHWNLIDRSKLELFVGGGAAYKTETDDINGSNWNFAEQLGWRFPPPVSGGRFEFAIRHVSNAGMKKPNKGEDFLSFAYVF